MDKKKFFVKKDNIKKKEKNINKKILESKKLIKDAKEKIKLEKRNIKKNKREEFKKTKFYKRFIKMFVFMGNDRDNYSFTEVLLITLFSLAIGAFACFSVMTVMSGGRNYFKLSKELSKFVEVYDTITENYNGDIDNNKLIEEAIKGMVSSVGDDYTNYVDVDNVSSFDELVGGIYEGIGCTIQLYEDGIRVVEIFDDSPALKGGLLVGDIILKVDDIDATNVNPDYIANYIKNESSDKIKMIVLRDGKEKEITLTRAEVETPVVNSAIHEVNGKKVGYLVITMFTSVASKQFETKLNELEDKGIDSLVIDVRSNNGGYLTTVTDIASLLLPKDSVIYQVEKDGDKTITKDKTIMKREYPIAILVDSSSASASEILAAVIKESYNGYVVGVTTYGKGTVQQAKKLSDGSMIKYTVENWLTPDGNWIDGKGVEPTHFVELNDEYYKNPIVENDTQLQKAFELVTK